MYRLNYKFEQEKCKETPVHVIRSVMFVSLDIESECWLGGFSHTYTRSEFCSAVSSTTSCVIT